MLRSRLANLPLFYAIVTRLVSRCGGQNAKRLFFFLAYLSSVFTLQVNNQAS